MEWSLDLTITTKHREWQLLDAITNDLDRRCYDASPAWGRTVYPDGGQRIGLGAFEITINPSLDRRLERNQERRQARAEEAVEAE